MTDVVSVVIGVEVLVDVEVKPDVDKVTLVSCHHSFFCRRIDIVVSTSP